MASLLTGATGFIGRNLLRELVSRGDRVIAISRVPANHCDESEQLVSWRRLPETVAEWHGLLEQVSTIYHLAWSSLPQSSNADPLLDASDNIIGTLTLLEAAKKAPNVRVVFSSSGGTVYGILASVPAKEFHGTQPRCAYGISKLAIEKYLGLYRELWGLDCVALRVSNAYGPGQQVGRNFGAISTFAAQLAAGEPITIFGDGSVIRDYIYIDDLVDAFIAAGNCRGGPTVVNIGSGVGKSLNDIVAELRQIHTSVEVNYLPGRDLDVPVSVLDISLAKAALNWSPHTSFEAGVERTAKAFLGNSGHRDESQMIGPAPVNGL
jgi:UDP-glucose 4-epimerase